VSRDAWQGLKGQIPAELKTNYLQAVISAGFKHIDAVSFVSPNAVPQMADSEEVLKDSTCLAMWKSSACGQRKRRAAAIATEKVRTLVFRTPSRDVFAE